MWNGGVFSQLCQFVAIYTFFTDCGFISGTPPPPPQPTGPQTSDQATHEKSKNENNLRAELLKGYETNRRPNQSVIVELSLVLMTINALDTKTQTLSSTGILVIMWSDQRLVWSEQNYDIRTLFEFEDNIWTPLIAVHNEVKTISVVSDSKIPITISSTGRVMWNPPRLMDTSCSMDVTFYPFDTQVCIISLAVFDHSTPDVILRGFGVDTEVFVSNGEWELTETKTEDLVIGSNQRHRSVVNFILTLKRRPTYYVLNAVIPSILMSFLAPFVFVLPAASGERTSYVITVFLSVVVMLTLILGQLPSSSEYPSIFSVYLATMTVLSAMAIPLTIINLSLFYKDGDEITCGLILAFGRCLRKTIQTRNKAKITPSEDEKITSEAAGVAPEEEDITKGIAGRGGSQGNTLTCLELANLLDVFYFRVFMVLTTGAGFVFFILLQLRPKI